MPTEDPAHGQVPEAGILPGRGAGWGGRRGRAGPGRARAGEGELYPSLARALPRPLGRGGGLAGTRPGGGRVPWAGRCWRSRRGGEERGGGRSGRRGPVKGSATCLREPFYTSFPGAGPQQPPPRSESPRTSAPGSRAPSVRRVASSPPACRGSRSRRR